MQWKQHIVKGKKFAWEVEPSYCFQARKGKTSGFHFVEAMVVRAGRLSSMLRYRTKICVGKAHYPEALRLYRYRPCQNWWCLWPCHGPVPVVRVCYWFTLGGLLPGPFAPAAKLEQTLELNGGKQKLKLEGDNKAVSGCRPAIGDADGCKSQQGQYSTCVTGSGQCASMARIGHMSVNAALPPRHM